MSEHITITTQPLPELPPAPTPYQQLVAEAFTAFDKILGIIPKLDEAEASGRKVASGRLGVPAAFVGTVVAAVEQLSELAAAKKLDPLDARDRMDYVEAFEPLYEKLFTFNKRLRFALLWVKDSLAADTLQMYRIARQIASDDRSPVMSAHVENMKRALARRVLSKAEREKRKLARMEKAVTEYLAKQQEVQKAA